MTQIGLPQFPIYDLRHTFAWRSAEVEVSPSTVVQILDHSLAGVAIKYARTIGEAEPSAIWKLEELKSAQEFMVVASAREQSIQ